MRTLAAAAAILALAPAAASAHPSKQASRRVAWSMLDGLATVYGDFDPRINRIGAHQAGHVRTAFSTMKHRCGHRGVDVCIRPVQIDVGLSTGGVPMVVDVRVYRLHQ